MFKMLNLAVHMPAGVNRVLQINLQANVILHSDSSSHPVIKPRVLGAVGRLLLQMGGELRPDTLLYYGTLRLLAVSFEKPR
jgi:hypothetical protein